VIESGRYSETGAVVI